MLELIGARPPGPPAGAPGPRLSPAPPPLFGSPLDTRLFGSRSCPSLWLTTRMDAATLRRPWSSVLTPMTLIHTLSPCAATSLRASIFSASLASRSSPRWALTCAMKTSACFRKPGSDTKMPNGRTDATVAWWMLHSAGGASPPPPCVPLGSRSSPVSWSTDRIDRLMRSPSTRSTFTNTSSPSATTTFISSILRASSTSPSKAPSSRSDTCLKCTSPSLEQPGSRTKTPKGRTERHAPRTILPAGGASLSGLRGGRSCGLPRWARRICSCVSSGTPQGLLEGGPGGGRWAELG